jgi:transcriptional regulator with XRE-family HTH domain
VNVPTDFGDELRSRRMGVGWSIRQLAAAAACGEATVRGLEQGLNDPSLEMIERLAAAMRVAPDYFRAYRLAVVARHPQAIDAAYLLVADG